MFWFKKIPWLSLTLLLIAYTAFGWIFSSWSVKAIAEGLILSRFEAEFALRLMYGLGASITLFIAILLSNPISVLTVGFGNWLKSDLRAFLSIFFGAFAFTLIFQWIGYVAKFLVLIAAALLLRLDLQQANANKWLSLLIMAISSLLGFTGGILAFYMWGSK